MRSMRAIWITVGAKQARVTRREIRESIFEYDSGTDVRAMCATCADRARSIGRSAGRAGEEKGAYGAITFFP